MCDELLDGGNVSPIEIKFTEELTKVVDYFRNEFNLTYAQAIGVLDMISFDLKSEAKDLDAY